MITNYAELRSAVIAWPDLQGEVDLEANVDTVIALAEARINQTLRLQGLLTTVSNTFASAVDDYQLPNDCLEVDWIAGSDGIALEARAVDDLLRIGHLINEPLFYTIDGRTIRFSGPVTGYTLRYYQQQPPLETSGSNWLFALAPDLYLYAALMEAAMFSKESEQETARYTMAYESAVNRIMQLDWASEYPKSQPLMMMPSQSAVGC